MSNDKYVEVMLEHQDWLEEQIEKINTAYFIIFDDLIEGDFDEICKNVGNPMEIFDKHLNNLNGELKDYIKRFKLYQETGEKQLKKAKFRID